MLAARLLDRTESLTAGKAREALTAADPETKSVSRTPEQLAAAKRSAQKSWLRYHLKRRAVIEIELGGMKFYPSFQFRDGRIIGALAAINEELASSCSDAEQADIARVLLDWWQSPHPDLPRDSDGRVRSPLDLLDEVPEGDFLAMVHETGALSSFVVPH